MKTRKMIAAVGAAFLVFGMAPAQAAEEIPGTCTEITYWSGGGTSVRRYSCECLVSAWPEVGHDYVIITYCTANIGGGDITQ